MRVPKPRAARPRTASSRSAALARAVDPKRGLPACGTYRGTAYAQRHRPVLVISEPERGAARVIT